MDWHWTDDPAGHSGDPRVRCIAAPGERLIALDDQHFVMTTHDGPLGFDSTNLPYPEQLSVLHLRHVGPTPIGTLTVRTWRSEAFDARQRFGPPALAVLEEVLSRATCDLMLGSAEDGFRR